MNRRTFIGFLASIPLLGSICFGKTRPKTLVYQGETFYFQHEQYLRPDEKFDVYAMHKWEIKTFLDRDTLCPWTTNQPVLVRYFVGVKPTGQIVPMPAMIVPGQTVDCYSYEAISNWRSQYGDPTPSRAPIAHARKIT